MVLSVLHEDPETHKMHLAVSRGDYNEVKGLLEAGVYANCHFVSGITEYPLHVAIAKEDIEMIKLLLKYGASPRCTDTASLTALHYAAMGNNVEIMRLLIEASDRIDVGRESPLNYAVRHSCVEMCDFLLNQGGIDINRTNFGDYTTLDIAEQIGNADIIGMLIEHGAVRGQRRGEATR